MILYVVLMAVALGLLMVEQVRISKMTPAERARLYRRGGVFRPPKHPKTYLRRRLLPGLSVLAFVGAFVVSIPATSPGPDRLQETLLTALGVLLVLAAFAFIGRMTYKRIAEDAARGLIPGDEPPEPW